MGFRFFFLDTTFKFQTPLPANAPKIRCLKRNDNGIDIFSPYGLECLTPEKNSELGYALIRVFRTEEIRREAPIVRESRKQFKEFRKKITDPTPAELKDKTKAYFRNEQTPIATIERVTSGWFKPSALKARKDDFIKIFSGNTTKKEELFAFVEEIFGTTASQIIFEQAVAEYIKKCFVELYKAKNDLSIISNKIDGIYRSVPEALQDRYKDLIWSGALAGIIAGAINAIEIDPDNAIEKLEKHEFLNDLKNANFETSYKVIQDFKQLINVYKTVELKIVGDEHNNSKNSAFGSFLETVQRLSNLEGDVAGLPNSANRLFLLPAANTLISKLTGEIEEISGKNQEKIGKIESNSVSLFCQTRAELDAIIQIKGNTEKKRGVENVLDEIEGYTNNLIMGFLLSPYDDDELDVKFAIEKVKKTLGILWAYVGDNFSSEVDSDYLNETKVKIASLEDRLIEMQYLHEFSKKEGEVDENIYSFNRYTYEPKDLLGVSKTLKDGILWLNEAETEIKIKVPDLEEKNKLLAEVEEKKKEIIRSQQALATEMLCILRHCYLKGDFDQVTIFKELSKNSYAKGPERLEAIINSYPFNEDLTMLFEKYIEENGTQGTKNELINLQKGKLNGVEQKNQTEAAQKRALLLNSSEIKADLVKPLQEGNRKIKVQGNGPLFDFSECNGEGFLSFLPWRKNRINLIKNFNEKAKNLNNLIRDIRKLSVLSKKEIPLTEDGIIVDKIQMVEKFIIEQRRLLKETITLDSDFNKLYGQMLDAVQNELNILATNAASNIINSMDATFNVKGNALISPQALKKYEKFINKKGTKENENDFKSKVNFFSKFMDGLYNTDESDGRFYLEKNNETKEVFLRKHKDEELLIEHRAVLCKKFHPEVKPENYDALKEEDRKKTDASITLAEKQIKAVELICAIVTGKQLEKSKELFGLESLFPVDDPKNPVDDAKNNDSLRNQLKEVLGVLPNRNGKKNLTEEGIDDFLIRTIARKLLVTLTLEKLNPYQVSIIKCLDEAQWHTFEGEITAAILRMQALLNDVYQIKENSVNINTGKANTVTNAEIAKDTRILSFDSLLRKIQIQNGGVINKNNPKDNNYGINNIIEDLQSLDDPRLPILEKILLHSVPPFENCNAAYLLKLTNLYFAKCQNKEALPSLDKESDRYKLLTTCKANFSKEQIEELKNDYISDDLIVEDLNLLEIVGWVTKRSNDSESNRLLSFKAIYFFLKNQIIKGLSDKAKQEKKETFDAIMDEIIGVIGDYTPEETAEFRDLVRLKGSKVKELVENEFIERELNDNYGQNHGEKELVRVRNNPVGLDFIYQYLPEEVKKDAAHTLFVSLIAFQKQSYDSQNNMTSDVDDSQISGGYVQKQMEFLRRIILDFSSNIGNDASDTTTFFTEKQLELLLNVINLSFLLEVTKVQSATDNYSTTKTEPASAYNGSDFNLWPLIKLMIAPIFAGNTISGSVPGFDVRKDRKLFQDGVKLAANYCFKRIEALFGNPDLLPEDPIKRAIELNTLATVSKECFTIEMQTKIRSFLVHYQHTHKREDIDNKPENVKMNTKLNDLVIRLDQSLNDRKLNDRKDQISIAAATIKDSNAYGYEKNNAGLGRQFALLKGNLVDKNDWKNAIDMKIGISPENGGKNRDFLFSQLSEWAISRLRKVSESSQDKNLDDAAKNRFIQSLFNGDNAIFRAVDTIIRHIGYSVSTISEAIKKEFDENHRNEAYFLRKYCDTLVSLDHAYLISHMNVTQISEYIKHIDTVIDALRNHEEKYFKVDFKSYQPTEKEIKEFVLPDELIKYTGKDVAKKAAEKEAIIIKLIREKRKAQNSYFVENEKLPGRLKAKLEQALLKELTGLYEKLAPEVNISEEEKNTYIAKIDAITKLQARPSLSPEDENKKENIIRVIDLAYSFKEDISVWQTQPYAVLPEVSAESGVEVTTQLNLAGKREAWLRDPNGLVFKIELEKGAKKGKSEDIAKKAKKISRNAALTIVKLSQTENIESKLLLAEVVADWFYINAKQAMIKPSPFCDFLDEMYKNEPILKDSERLKETILSMPKEFILKRLKDNFLFIELFKTFRKELEVELQELKTAPNNQYSEIIARAHSLEELLKQESWDVFAINCQNNMEEHLKITNKDKEKQKAIAISKFRDTCLANPRDNGLVNAYLGVLIAQTTEMLTLAADDSEFDYILKFAENFVFDDDSKNKLFAVFKTYFDKPENQTKEKNAMFISMLTKEPVKKAELTEREKCQRDFRINLSEYLINKLVTNINSIDLEKQDSGGLVIKENVRNLLDAHVKVHGYLASFGKVLGEKISKIAEIVFAPLRSLLDKDKKNAVKNAATEQRNSFINTEDQVAFNAYLQAQKTITKNVQVIIKENYSDIEVVKENKVELANQLAERSKQTAEIDIKIKNLQKEKEESEREIQKHEEELAKKLTEIQENKKESYKANIFLADLLDEEWNKKNASLGSLYEKLENLEKNISIFTEEKKICRDEIVILKNQLSEVEEKLLHYNNLVEYQTNTATSLSEADLKRLIELVSKGEVDKVKLSQFILLNDYLSDLDDNVGKNVDSANKANQLLGRCFAKLIDLNSPDTKLSTLYAFFEEKKLDKLGRICAKTLLAEKKNKFNQEYPKYLRENESSIDPVLKVAFDYRELANKCHLENPDELISIFVQNELAKLKEANKLPAEVISYFKFKKDDKLSFDTTDVLYEEITKRCSASVEMLCSVIDNLDIFMISPDISNKKIDKILPIDKIVKIIAAHFTALIMQGFGEACDKGAVESLSKLVATIMNSAALKSCYNEKVRPRLLEVVENLINQSKNMTIDKEKLLENVCLELFGLKESYTLLNKELPDNFKNSSTKFEVNFDSLFNGLFNFYRDPDSNNIDDLLGILKEKSIALLDSNFRENVKNYFKDFFGLYFSERQRKILLNKLDESLNKKNNFHEKAKFYAKSRFVIMALEQEFLLNNTLSCPTLNCFLYMDSLELFFEEKVPSKKSCLDAESMMEFIMTHGEQEQKDRVVNVFLPKFLPKIKEFKSSQDSSNNGKLVFPHFAATGLRLLQKYDSTNKTLRDMYAYINPILGLLIAKAFKEPEELKNINEIIASLKSVNKVLTGDAFAIEYMLSCLENVFYEIESKDEIEAKGKYSYASSFRDYVTAHGTKAQGEKATELYNKIVEISDEGLVLNLIKNADRFDASNMSSICSAYEKILRSGNEEFKSKSAMNILLKMQKYNFADQQLTSKISEIINKINEGHIVEEDLDWLKRQLLSLSLQVDKKLKGASGPSMIAEGAKMLLQTFPSLNSLVNTISNTGTNTTVATGTQTPAEKNKSATSGNSPKRNEIVEVGKSNNSSGSGENTPASDTTGNSSLTRNNSSTSITQALLETQNIKNNVIIINSITVNDDSDNNDHLNNHTETIKIEESKIPTIIQASGKDNKCVFHSFIIGLGDIISNVKNSCDLMKFYGLIDQSARVGTQKNFFSSIITTKFMSGQENCLEQIRNMYLHDKEGLQNVLLNPISNIACKDLEANNSYIELLKTEALSLFLKYVEIRASNSNYLGRVFGEMDTAEGELGQAGKDLKQLFNEAYSTLLSENMNGGKTEESAKKAISDSLAASKDLEVQMAALTTNFNAAWDSNNFSNRYMGARKKAQMGGPAELDQLGKKFGICVDIYTDGVHNKPMKVGDLDSTHTISVIRKGLHYDSVIFTEKNLVEKNDIASISGSSRGLNSLTVN